jgi:hypothetical protein
MKKLSKNVYYILLGIGGLAIILGTYISLSAPIAFIISLIIYAVLRITSKYRGFYKILLLINIPLAVLFFSIENKVGELSYWEQTNCGFAISAFEKWGYQSDCWYDKKINIDFYDNVSLEEEGELFAIIRLDFNSRVDEILNSSNPDKSLGFWGSIKRILNIDPVEKMVQINNIYDVDWSQAIGITIKKDETNNIVIERPLLLSIEYYCLNYFWVFMGIYMMLFFYYIFK